ncbi:MAG: 50S ribosomal protein L37e [Candidatus Aenigmarchaeota archaeon]
MTKGTASFGKMNKKTHIICRRCGKHAYHVNRRTCAACGFGTSAKKKTYAWQQKANTGKCNRLK